MSKYCEVDNLKRILLGKARQESNIENPPYSWSFAYKCFAEMLDEFTAEDVAPVIHARWNTSVCCVECS